MATYTELRELFNNGDLLNKIDVAVVIAANNLINGTPAAKDTSWAANVFNMPRGEARKALMAILAENQGLTITQITGATDTAIQAKVDGIIPALVNALAGV
ncbi:MAG: hypothetical protein ACUZ8H_13280 [Candidatus Anammoxibacter sp.]